MTDNRPVLELSRSGEGETLEFKEQWNEAALETLAGFANSRGGTLVVGVDDIVDDKLLKGNLFQQLEQAMQVFQQYLQVRYEIPKEMGELTGVEALRRKEIWDYPLDALREAVLNALIHRDYFETSGDVQIRVYDDRVVISNPGALPDGMAVDELRQEGHRSIPRNPLIAQAFYYASLIEKWGTGTTRMMEMCRAQGLPEPEFVSERGWFEITFLKDPYTEERLREMGLNERQIRAVQDVKAKGGISNKEYQDLTGVSKRTATRDLEALVQIGLFHRLGETGRGTHYALMEPERGQRGHKGVKRAKGGQR